MELVDVVVVVVFLAVVVVVVPDRPKKIEKTFCCVCNMNASVDSSGGT